MKTDTSLCVAILLSTQSITKTFAARTLFEKISFSIASGERIGLIGPNGAGKSTLFKILAGEMDPDSGSLSIQKGLRIGFLSQVPTFKKNETVMASILEGAIDPHDWSTIAKAQELMSKLSLTELGPDTPIESLSGGWKKRVALARELLREPDLLLLDEPTNHLDVESILWLEEFLANSSFATMTITHDRVFLQKVSNRIVELDRRHKDGILSVQGDYTDYLEIRQNLLAAQETHEIKLRNTLRRETEWLRRGAQARQTKQQARIGRAEDLRQDVDQLASRNQVSTAKLDFKSLEKNPKKLIEAKGLSKSYHGKVVIPKIDLLLAPQSRIGLIGANGCGKSTLIRLLLKTEEPDSGSVFHADRLQVAYFEQNRDSLNPTVSVLKTVCPDGDFVNLAGEPVHARSYLSRFLFSHPQMDLPVGRLSGGEQARLLLAKLMLRPANVLVLDEPTNDLDMATLDVLQDVLSEFQGAVILVSHDRYFLDQVSTKLLAFGYGPGQEKQIVSFADLSQWEEWHAQQAKAARAETKANAQNQKTKKKKLGYKETRELEGLEPKILEAETQLAALTEESSKPEVVSDAPRLLEITKKMSQLQSEIEQLYARWALLDADQAPEPK